MRSFMFFLLLFFHESATEAQNNRVVLRDGSYVDCDVIWIEPNAVLTSLRGQTRYFTPLRAVPNSGGFHRNFLSLLLPSDTFTGIVDVADVKEVSVVQSVSVVPGYAPVTKVFTLSDIQAMTFVGNVWLTWVRRPMLSVGCQPDRPKKFPANWPAWAAEQDLPKYANCSANDQQAWENYVSDGLKYQIALQHTFPPPPPLTTPTTTLPKSGGDETVCIDQPNFIGGRYWVDHICAPPH